MRFIANGESASDISRGGVDESEVGFVFLVKWSWYANEDGIGFSKATCVGSGAEEGGMLEDADEIRAEMVEVGLTSIEHFDLFGIVIDTDDITAGVEHGAAEGESDISESDDGDGERVRQLEGSWLDCDWHALVLPVDGEIQR